MIEGTELKTNDKTVVKLKNETKIQFHILVDGPV